MRTITVEVIVDGTAYHASLYIDGDGNYRGRGLPERAVYDATAREALNAYCKGFADALEGRVGNGGNPWYDQGWDAGDNWGSGNDTTN